MPAVTMYRAGTEILIDPGNRRLSLMLGDQLVKTYPIAVGKSSTPTPAGEYKVINKVLNPGGVLGTRWMGLNIPGGNYGIHGTNNPPSIGTRASLGCIRMYNQNVEELFPVVPVGTTVRIIVVPGYNDWFNPQPNTAAQNGPPLDHSVYIIKPGDTLWKLAQQYNIPVEVLMAANNLVDPGNLQVGQPIYIPK